MSRQYFNEVLAPIMEADQTAVTGTAAAPVWNPSPWTAFVANQLQPGQIYRLFASGVMSTAASTPGTLLLAPYFSQSNTAGAGTALGASATSPTLTASKTNVPWFLEALLQCRNIGSSGSAVLNGVFHCDQAGVTTPLVFGGPATTVDTTSAQGIRFDVTLGSATDSMTTRMVVVEALN